MSFLGELVGSIGGNRAPAPPVNPPSRPGSTNPTQSNISKSAPATPGASAASKAPYKGTASTAPSQQGAGAKRKAEDMSAERPVKLTKSSPVTIPADRGGQKPKPLNTADVISPASAKATNGIPSPKTGQEPTKVPAKGSYAAMLARAKEAQQSKTQSQIGMIKHHAKDKVKTSNWAERRKQEQEQQKGKSAVAANQQGNGGTNGRLDSRRRSLSPVKKGESIKPKQPQAPKPPLHGPPAAYKGTMGRAPKHSREELRKKSARYDDYLGTDEEDEEDDSGRSNRYDQFSDEDAGSDDMEGGGFDELEQEEREAERIARQEDARELALEQKLKQEKLERKQKLAALAKKQK